MVNKTLLSLAVAASVATLAGCNTGGDTDVDLTPVTSGQEGAVPSRTAPIFSAANAELPLNTDFLFAAAPLTDGTAATADTIPPVTTAINDLAGWSTTATFYIPFNAPLDPDSVKAGDNVRLIELASKEDNPAIDALSIDSILASETRFAAQDDQPVGKVDYDARYVRLTDGIDAIAVTPLRPLDPITKYLVVVTDGVKDVAGKSVGPSGEYNLVAGDAILPSPALQPVRDNVQKWEALAGEYLAENTDSVTEDNIILAYATTTDGSTNVLTRYANPALFVADNLELEAAEDLTDVFAQRQLGEVLEDIVARKLFLGAFESNENPTVDDLKDVTPQEIAQAKALEIYPGAVFGAITTTDVSSFSGATEPETLNDLVAAPKPRDVSLVNGALVDALIEFGTLGSTIDLSAAIPGIIGGTAPTLERSFGASPRNFGTGISQSARYYQGQIALPNFLTPANKTEELTATGITATLASDAAWTANRKVGAVLDVALSNAPGTTPPADNDGSTNVTYRYPLPELVTDENDSSFNIAPILITAPSEADCGVDTPVPVVIYVHGITGSRGNGAIYSAALAANCIATVAIDQPLHGVAPKTSNADGKTIDNALLFLHIEAEHAEATGSPWANAIKQQNENTLLGDKITAEERHNNVYQNDLNARVDIVYNEDKELSAGDSGSAFINLFNFARGRDNLRQSVFDLLNLNASLGKIDEELQSQGALVQTPSQFDLSEVYVVGHSLGAIVATTFSSVNNNPLVQAGNSNLNQIKGVILANGGANLTKLLENSPGFGPSIVGALGGSGIEQGSDSFESFMFVFQSMIDGTDPAGSGLELATTSTPVLQFNMVGGNPLPEDSSEISLPDALKAFGTFLPDHTVPNFDYFADAGTNPYVAAAPKLGLPAGIDTAYAPLAGTSGLSEVLGTSEIVNQNNSTAVSNPLRVETRFASGTHSTFANADEEDTFKEMVAQSVGFIKNGAVQATDSNVLELE